MSTIPIAVQLYSVRHAAEADLPGTLARIKAMGYEGVEFAGWYGHDSAAIRRMLADAGLRCAGAHVGIDSLRGDRLEESVAFALEIDNPYLIVPWLPAETIDDWKAAAEELNGISMRIAPRGLRTGYHNHDKEFRPSPSGELPWDAFFGTADPSVIMQFDTGNALSGGGEAVPFLARYPGRAITVHLKEYDPATKSFAPPIGRGGVPFEQVFAECESSGGTRWYIVEYEDPALDPFDGIEQCLAGLRALGK